VRTVTTDDDAFAHNDVSLDEVRTRFGVVPLRGGV
jgi:hypothetical protein